jgi:hypothetical protein
MNEQETVAASIPTKKQIRKQISEKLTGALADYKQELGEKKLAIRVKKASKLISRDLEKFNRKQQQKIDKSVTKKSAAKKSAAKKSKTVKSTLKSGKN